MSVLLSTTLLCLFSLAYSRNHALQVGRFWDIQKNGMVFSLSADLDQAEGAVSVEGSRGQHLAETGLTDVVRAGAGDEDAAGAEHFQSPKIEFFVAAMGGVEIALALSEGRRVENDSVVVVVGGGIVLEEGEGGPLDPFNLFSIQTLMVERCVLVGNFEGRTGAIDAGDVRATRGEMKGEASLIAEDVESFAFGVLSGDGV